MVDVIIKPTENSHLDILLRLRRLVPSTLCFDSHPLLRCGVWEPWHTNIRIMVIQVYANRNRCQDAVRDRASEKFSFHQGCSVSHCQH